ncbi:MAG: LPS export ABC transporter permease LptG [Deltaproteobacteria bacterium]|nr:LPS export ABC transporter permease LptG [Deltaproteobacteria bacterium]
MRILTDYVAREFLKMFGFLLLAFVAIYTLFDFIEKVDNFSEAGVQGSIMAVYFIYQVPALLSLLAPLAILMGTVICLGLMSKHGEVVAVKSAGISIFRFTLPIVLIAMGLAFASALLNESVIPNTKARTNQIWEVQVEKRPGRFYHREKFYYKGANSVYHVGFYDPETHSLSNVVYYRLDPSFNLVERVDARRARYLSGKWTFFSGLYQKRLPEGGYTAVPFEQKVLELPERPDDFNRLSKPSEEMSLGELNDFVHKAELEGYDTRRQRVDLQTKISYPFVCLIMALLGIPLALFHEGGRSLASGIVLGMAAALVYWVFFSYVRSIFGYAGVLPPFISAWLPNVVFILASLGLLTSIRQ